MVDRYESRFGIREVRFDSNQGIFINGEHIRIRASTSTTTSARWARLYNHRAAQRQLEILREMGCNAIRMSHNPPASELLGCAMRWVFSSWTKSSIAGSGRKRHWISISSFPSGTSRTCAHSSVGIAIIPR